MRVGLISFHSFLNPGGVKRHILGLHKEFKKRGIYSKIIVPRRSKSENYGKDVVILGTSFPLKFSGSQSDFCVNFNPIAIRAVLEKEKFDVLHFHNFGFPSAFQILERSEALNILTFHANVEKSKFLNNFPVFLYLLNKISQWKIDGVTGVAPVNLKVFSNFKGPKKVIANGIDLKEFNPETPPLKKFLKDKQDKKNKINILFVGRIEERKGLIYLLRAFKILEKNFSKGQKIELKLIIVGDGPLKADCRQWTKKNRLKNVYFEGEKSGRILSSYYASADIFVSPAIYGESFGIVLLEAMASGVPVAAFANRGYRDFLKDKKAGEFLVKPKDHKTLAQKIEILIKNPGLREKLKKSGLKEVKEYSWPKITDKVLDFYEICRKEKQTKKKEKFFLHAFDKNIEKLYDKTVPNWLKPK